MTGVDRYRDRVLLLVTDFCSTYCRYCTRSRMVGHGTTHHISRSRALCGLFNVLKTIKEEDQLPLNLIFTIEGEEEIGSPNFEPFIRAHQAELKADGLVDFDFSQDTEGKVSMHLGLKGIVYLDLICRGGKKGGPVNTSLHGSDSAWVSSPVWRLIHALSSLTDK